MTEDDVRRLLVERCVEKPGDIGAVFRKPKNRADPAAGHEWLADFARTVTIDGESRLMLYVVVIDDATGEILRTHVG